MKTKNIFLAALAVTGLVLTGCSKTEVPTPEESVATMTITLENGHTATQPSVSRTQENLAAVDSKIFSYQVYVFGWSSGILEGQATGVTGGRTTITGLSTGSTKRVVVLANLDTYPQVTNFSELSGTTYKYDLDRQSPDVVKEKGYLMSGLSASAVTLTKDGPNEERITLKRAVAKVSLESLTFKPEEGHEIGKLRIKGVSAQRVAPEVSLVPITSYYGNKHYGGIANSDPELEVKSYLYDALDLGTVPYTANQPYNLGNYFLIFPNLLEANRSLLTIEAEYGADGQRETLYYPIKINSQAQSNFVEANKHYKIDLTLKKFGNGTTDPEIPSEEADLDVYVEVEEWTVVLQSEEW